MMISSTEILAVNIVVKFHYSNSKYIYISLYKFVVNIQIDFVVNFLFLLIQTENSFQLSVIKIENFIP